MRLFAAGDGGEPHLTADVDHDVARAGVHRTGEQARCDLPDGPNSVRATAGLLRLPFLSSSAPLTCEAVAPATGWLRGPKWIQRPSTTMPANVSSSPLKRAASVQRRPSHQRILPRPSSIPAGLGGLTCRRGTRVQLGQRSRRSM